MPELIVPIRRRGVLVKVFVRQQPSASPEGNAEPVGPLSAYLDTGASDTMFDLDLIRSMGLQPVEQAALNILGCAEVRFHETYEVEVALVAPQEPLCWVPLTILGGAVYPTGAVAAIGRDFLTRVVLTYDGPREQARLSW